MIDTIDTSSTSSTPNTIECVSDEDEDNISDDLEETQDHDHIDIDSNLDIDGNLDTAISTVLDFYMEPNNEQTNSPLWMPEREETIKFVKSMRFLLKAGISERVYAKYFVDSPFYSSDLMPTTLRTCKRRLLKLVEHIVQVGHVFLSYKACTNVCTNVI
jgi:hypothetical protein